jgi:4-amino-4-deoxy-L-arabinose transferase-like glycosyltransferase
VVVRTLAIVALVILLRVPFLNQPIQGDDVYYLYGAQHAQIDPLHPLDTRYMFLGDMVDMRGHPHGPMDSWILAILLAALGDIREIPFHAAYAVFSIIAALAMWSLARRFCERPFIATLLFLAVPAFVVNGNSLEADLPFLAFWMAAVTLFVHAVDNQSTVALMCSTVAGALAGLTA